MSWLWFPARPVLTLLLLLLLNAVALAQSVPAKAALGSRTAKAGFRNEDEIAAKFNNWRTDTEARAWLSFMGWRSDQITSVAAIKPHGEKADIQVRVETGGGASVEGISIKLVTGPQGFNQIDKRWLRQYARMWAMPPDVEAGLGLFLGEVKPNRRSRNAQRMFLDELDPAVQKRMIEFFSTKKAEIVSDLFRGDGEFSARWMMVCVKASASPRWILRSIEHAIKFYSDGPVEITRQGNLRIGRITMQRKGGDGGRETARMLQFKINPALLFRAE